MVIAAKLADVNYQLYSGSVFMAIKHVVSRYDYDSINLFHLPELYYDE